MTNLATQSVVWSFALAAGLQAQTTLFELSGTSANQKLGKVIDEVGDVNGDGALDVLIADATSITLRTGHSGALIKVLTTPFAAAAGVGDINLDGVPDVLVNHKLYSGATLVAIGTVIPVAPGSLWAAVGDIDGPGDVDLDGFPDLLVGTPYEGLPISECGGVRVYSGQTLHEIQISVGGFNEDYYGFHVSAAGDVNADGYADYAASTDYVGGYSRVYSGRNGNLLHSYGIGLPGNAPISGLGEVNGDGFADYAVAASGGKDVAVRSGKDGALLGWIDFNAKDHDLALARVGDVDGDGRADILIGDAQSGFPGTAPGRVRVHSGASLALLYEIDGEVPLGGFGSSLAGVGDVDGDGLADFGVGSPGAASGAVASAGSAEVISGEPCGKFDVYGHGCPGTGFIRPELFAEGCTSFGSAVTLTVADAIGGATGLLVFGASPAGIPIFGGCTLNVTPLFPAMLPLTLGGVGPGAGTASFTGNIPMGGPQGVICMQAFFSDPGAPTGFSNTEGISLTVVP